MRLTDLAHELLRIHLQPGDLAVDGTAGKGHDTLFLARAVAPNGHVIAFDPQTSALTATQSRLTQAGISSQTHIPDSAFILHPSSFILSVCLLGTGHENAPDLLRHYPSPRAVVLNLGYLPGADHAVTTSAETTLTFLRWAAATLAPEGILSILAYRAHPGGEEEALAVADFVRQLALSGWSHESHQGPPGRSPSPVLHFLRKP